jgi:hypothetical protein
LFVQFAHAENLTLIRCSVEPAARKIGVVAFGRKLDYLLFLKKRRSAETPLQQIEFVLIGEIRVCILSRSKNA